MAGGRCLADWRQGGKAFGHVAFEGRKLKRFLDDFLGRSFVAADSANYWECVDDSKKVWIMNSIHTFDLRVVIPLDKNPSTNWDE